MRRVVLIEDSLDARNYVRDHAPADWEMLEAADGLSGVVRQLELPVAIIKTAASARPLR
jgi:hypothetical protein